jgi:hypothetical protein
MNDSPKFMRLPLLALAIMLLLAGLWAGLIRLGWSAPKWYPLLGAAWQPALPMAHGPLMIGGFLGTLISLERAVATQRPWGYAAPALSGLGTLLLVAGVPGWPGPALILLASATLLGVMGQLWRLHPTLFTAAMGLGAMNWLVGNALWLAGQPLPTAVLWWAGFLVFTIAGERLELSRLLRLSRMAYGAFAACIFLWLAGLAASVANFAAGMGVVGVGMTTLAVWLLRYDIAQRRLKAGGQARFIAVSLLSGYVWLGFSGLLAIYNGGATAGPTYDAALHALFLGFVFAMIFAHAPIIFPAVLKLPVVYTPRFYSHLILLHLTLILRIVSDLLLWQPGRLWGGLLNAVVLLLFLVNTIVQIHFDIGNA